MLLAGKTALVTGSARGIGEAIAERFAEEGCSVIIADVNTDEGAAATKRIQEKGGNAVFAALDVTDEQSVKGVFEGIPQLDILVNNAGVTRSGSVDGLTLEEWSYTMGVNLTSVFLCSKYALPLLFQSDAPSIVNMSSVNSFCMNPGLPAYAASKGGIVSLTMQMAMEYAAKRVRVNCISPGLTQKQSAKQGPRNEIMLDCYPLGRVGQLKDVANAALFLSSGMGAFVNGIDLVVDGGMSLQAVSALVRPELRKKWKTGTYQLVREEEGG